MALLGAFCTQYPDAKLAIIFLPFFTFSAQSVGIFSCRSICISSLSLSLSPQALIGLITFDLVGTLFRWKFLDHSAHLGGVLFGMSVLLLLPRPIDGLRTE